MDQVKPSEPKLETPVVTKISLVKTKPADIPTKVTDLDSGDITITNNDEVASKLKSLNLFNISTLCNLYVQYEDEFGEFNYNDNEYSNKFSSTLEQIIRKYDYGKYLEVNDYLKTQYDSIFIDKDITITTFSEVTYKVYDSIFIDKDRIIIPKVLDKVIDYFISDTIHNSKDIYILETGNTRGVLPTLDLNILGIDKSHCHSCYYKTICVSAQ